MELIPITWPAKLIKGPPELPGLMAASVWITVAWPVALPELSVTSIVRFLAEIIPSVNEVAYWEPNGEPIAKAVSPTWILSESPNDATCVTSLALIFNTAKSLTASCPTSVAETFLPLAKIISILLDPETTWLLVTMKAVFPDFL